MLIFKGRRTTADGGSFEVETFSRNLPGTDRIVTRASNLSRGEMCKASATI
jgi:hypothetical protein